MANQSNDEKKENKENDLPEFIKKPILGEQPTDLLHTRRNLLLVTFITVFCFMNELVVKPHFLNEYVLKGSDISPFHINLAAFFITSYLLLSFMWKFWDYYKSQIILTTRFIRKDSGSGVSFAQKLSETSFAQEELQYYSIYNWWHSVQKQAPKKMQTIDQFIEKLNHPDDLKIDDKFISEIKGIKESLASIRSGYYPDNKVIEASMKHFDRSFNRFLYSQKLRVILFEGLFPFVMGISAIIILICQLIPVKVICS